MGAGGVIAATALAGVVVVGAGAAAPPDDSAWRGIGLRVLDQVTRDDRDCAANSFGQVRELLTAAPCASLSRMLITLADAEDDVVAVAVAWVEFGAHDTAAEFKRVEDIHGTGDITPLSARLLLRDEITFTAHHYASQQQGSTVVVAEAETTEGQATPEFLRRVAEVAVRTPRP
ncbi:hypothetical protein [Saccharothrix algeriensis]|uniref:Uncharacterized protein n=1 Tax=Saccharothrix algeriensis TaxID=173560 RepID=A0A8T8HY05_9PSEU|nr:hypothetical protein [Saccharothrix algeriensis]MBM7815234.1 hypothetical protein [Saccharothrix algeriensis]QTR03465.1 hypothetical protein J7S33_32000 [Saccharothrix algeriensis]